MCEVVGLVFIKHRKQPNTWNIYYYIYSNNVI